jgi:hypothetical protein
MKALRLLLYLIPALIPPPLCFAVQEIPPPRLGALADRILFLVALWVLIAALLVILRWKISLADSLFRMFPQGKGTESKKDRKGNPHQEARTAEAGGRTEGRPEPL